MYAYQVLTLLGYYFLKEAKYVMVVGLLYFALACFLLFQALDGQPFING